MFKLHFIFYLLLLQNIFKKMCASNFYRKKHIKKKTILLKFYMLTDFMTNSRTLTYQHSKTNIYGFIGAMHQDHNLQILQIRKKNKQKEYFTDE